MTRRQRALLLVPVDLATITADIAGWLIIQAARLGERRITRFANQTHQGDPE